MPRKRTNPCPNDVGSSAKQVPEERKTRRNAGLHGRKFIGPSTEKVKEYGGGANRGSACCQRCVVNRMLVEMFTSRTRSDSIHAHAIVLGTISCKIDRFRVVLCHEKSTLLLEACLAHRVREILKGMTNRRACLCQLLPLLGMPILDPVCE